jgi:Lar family restriction alleviation protein
MAELKPCPFCGATDNKKLRPTSGVELSREEGIFQVFCWECGASSGYFRTEQEAIEAWNRRVDNGYIWIRS